MKLSQELLCKMLDAARDTVRAEIEMLNRLDAATGDGDHGTAIVTAMNAAAEAVRKEGSLSSVLESVGLAIMTATSGSTSTLIGSFYLGMGLAAPEEAANTDQVIAMFESGLENVRFSSKAQVGDKTMMDALIPAIEAMSKQKGTETSLPELFREAAQAATAGAESTEGLVAKFGRAKNLGPRSIGHRDAGAVSTAMILSAYADVSRAS